jgi:methylenetetrahydrofolate dehydrogenase (NADP+)/methenyltetrahydrofolate cyclohydrolase
MIIDGKSIAEAILDALNTSIQNLKKKGVIPTMAVIQVGDDPASLAYIRQKQKAADKIGARLILDHLEATISVPDLTRRIDGFNGDSSIHGLIIQRPIPPKVGDVTNAGASVLPVKDIDGFLSNSPFETPVALAVGEMLRDAFVRKTSSAIDVKDHESQFIEWVRTQKIAVIGRGVTAGEPILRYFNKLHCTTSNIHSRTEHPESLIRDADIIISCVGKEHVVTGDMVKSGAIAISVGIWRDMTGKLHGDYDEGDIAGKASFYSPTPGGVGPVNVACLMQNLVKACTLSQGGTS